MNSGYPRNDDRNRSITHYKIEMILPDKIYEFVLANGSSRDDEDAGKDHREFGGHGSDRCNYAKERNQ